MWSKLLLDTCDFALRVVARTKQVLHFRKRCQKQDSPLPGWLNYPTRGSLKRRRAHFLWVIELTSAIVVPTHTRNQRRSSHIGTSELFLFSPEPVSYFLSQVSFSLARHGKQVATSCYVLSRFFLSHPSHIGSICRRRDALGTHTVGSALMSGVEKRFLEFMAVYLLNPQ